MFGASELTDELIASAVNGTPADTRRILELVSPQVELMVTARLSPTPGRLHDVQEIAQLAMVALSRGLPRLRTRTKRGLRAYMSGIVARKVADHLKRRGEGDLTGPRAASLDATVSRMSGTGPLWQLLSAGGRSPTGLGSTRSALVTSRRKFCLCNFAPLSASATPCNCSNVNSPGNSSNTTGL